MKNIIDIIILPSDEIDPSGNDSTLHRYRLYFTSVGMSPHIVTTVEEFKVFIELFGADVPNFRVWIHLVSNKKHQEIFIRGQTMGKNFKNKFPQIKFAYLVSGKPPVDEIENVKVFDVMGLNNDPDYFLKNTENLNINDMQEIEQIYYAIITDLYDECESIEDIIDKKTVEKIGKSRNLTGLSTLQKAKLKDSDKWILYDFQIDMGMVDSSILSTLILTNFPNLKYLIMIGVCGGRKTKNVNLCDLIIPKNILNYQAGKIEMKTETLADGNSKSWEEFKFYHNSEKGNQKDLLQVWKIIRNAMEENASSNLKTKCRNMTVHFDDLACGSMVVKAEGKIEEIAKLDEKVVGLEMESFGVARACFLTGNKTKPLIIKSVMDFTDGKKNDSVKGDASYLSAQFAYHLIKGGYLE